MQLTTERYELRQAEIAREINRPRDEAYARNVCPDCGWEEGMASYDREAVRWMMEQEFTFPNEWWISHDDICVPSSYIHQLYRRCGTCRPMDAPDSWLKVLESYVKDWASIRCYCVDCQLKEAP